MKILPVAAEMFHADRRTDKQMEGRTDGRTDRHEKAIRPFLNFANAPKNYWVVCNILKSCKFGFKLMSSKYRTKSLKNSQSMSVFVALY